MGRGAPARALPLEALLLLLVLLRLPACGALRLEPAAAGHAEDWRECGWKKFGSGYLEGLQYIRTTTDHLPFANFDHGSTNKEGLFVYPKANLAMCIIEKNGCSSWTTLFNKMCHKVSMKSAWYGIVPFYWSAESATKVFENKKSTRIVWVREPLERFLSGFLDKCTDWNPEGGPELHGGASPQARAVHQRDYQRICNFGFGKLPGTFSLSQVMQWFATGRKARDLDSHFSPQSWHCELKRRLQEYNVVGLMTKANFSRDARCILERAHLDDLNKRAGDDGNFFFQRREALEDQETRQVEILKRFFTKEMAHFMIDIYKEDYELFRIKRPTWVDHATGEWYNVQPSIARASLRRRTDAGDTLETHSEGEDGAEDDIELLAARAGFTLPTGRRAGS